MRAGGPARAAIRSWRGPRREAGSARSPRRCQSKSHPRERGPELRRAAWAELLAQDGRAASSRCAPRHGAKALCSVDASLPRLEKKLKQLTPFALKNQTSAILTLWINGLAATIRPLAAR